MCDSTPRINTNCSMVTPQIVCDTYNYTIYNISSHVSNGTLTLITSGIYYFNFTEGKGDYIIQLCDGTTREVYVKADEENNMIFGITIIVPLILGLMFLFIAYSLDDSHNILKIFLMLLSIVTFIISMQFASMSISFFYSFTEMIEVLTDYTLSAVIILFILLVYFFIVGIRWYVKKMKMKKEEEDNPYE